MTPSLESHKPRIHPEVLYCYCPCYTNCCHCADMLLDFFARALMKVLSHVERHLASSSSNCPRHHSLGFLLRPLKPVWSASSVGLVQIKYDIEFFMFGVVHFHAALFASGLQFVKKNTCAKLIHSLDRN